MSVKISRKQQDGIMTFFAPLSKFVFVQSSSGLMYIWPKATFVGDRNLSWRLSLIPYSGFLIPCNLKLLQVIDFHFATR
jgi:hypothetical protein